MQGYYPLRISPESNGHLFSYFIHKFFATRVYLSISVGINIILAPIILGLIKK